ncbi:sodium/potassium-transporting ATPase subunit beta-1 [Drosophila pseudoobscura]|uniref:Sodium/potassium-transporting ATPase subunit beta-1 n=1 Tax=Drosophila pseudoobscura pseudoobscura TaxID=46245 RepID=Q29P11_DROPS|nr:sodium/potassium-transporting ATPase subunit beta-1 [Drosophila pseudoobscura]
MSKNNGKSEKAEYEFYQPAKKQTFRQMVYDSQEGTYFGRTIKSWGQLMLFYGIFYIVLATLFSICMQGLLSTISSKEPKWQLKDSLIGTNPGLGFRPLSEQTERGSVIEFDGKKPAESDYWIELIDEFLIDYNHTEGREMKHCGFGQTHNPIDVCVVNTELFGACSKANNYGYKSNEPCIFLKLNKIFGWVPEVYEAPEKGMPEDLTRLITNTSQEERKQIWVSCNGHLGKDKENFQNISYYPSQGFPSFYYPYLNQPGYLSPLVAVQFHSPPKGQMLDVECRAWAKNVIYSGSARDRMGSVTFQIVVE